MPNGKSDQGFLNDVLCPLMAGPGGKTNFANNHCNKNCAFYTGDNEDPCFIVLLCRKISGKERELRAGEARPQEEKSNEPPEDDAYKDIG